MNVIEVDPNTQCASALDLLSKNGVFSKWRPFLLFIYFSFLFFSFFVVVVVVVVSTSSSSWSSFSSSATPLKWRRQRRLMSSDHICHVDTFPFIRFDSSFYHLIYIYIYIYWFYIVSYWQIQSFFLSWILLLFRLEWLFGVALARVTLHLF